MLEAVNDGRNCLVCPIHLLTGVFRCPLHLHFGVEFETEVDEVFWFFEGQRIGGIIKGKCGSKPLGFSFFFFFRFCFVAIQLARQLQQERARVEVQ